MAAYREGLAISLLRSLQKTPALLREIFQHPSTRYAA